MRPLRILAVALLALSSLTPVAPARADNMIEYWQPATEASYWWHWWRNRDRWTRGVPGPVVGAGLPMLVLAGAGAVWFVRRRRSAKGPASASNDVTNQEPR
jgi:hypothetical protein